MDIVLEEVSFAYLNASESAVDTLTMTIKAGETLAIVGENGSGKSTLTRLITGIYKPTSGKVTVGGCGTDEVNMSSLFKKVSGVFQDYQRYPLTLSSNISISDINAVTSDEKLDNVTGMAGVDVKSRSFDKGYDTMLSRDFDGIDLSGGQWQRVALARAIANTAPIRILDEPTAALDPIAESHVYALFGKVSRNSTQEKFTIPCNG